MSDQTNEPISVNADKPLTAIIPAFEQHMQEEGFAVNTIKSFCSDVRLMAGYLKEKPVGQIDTKDLNGFLNWLLNERRNKQGNRVPCSPKSYARRVTTMKVLFGWLRKSDALYINPAEAVVQTSATSPLPVVPTNEEIDRALAVTAAWSEGLTIRGIPRKKDTRPHALLHLLLQIGAKKGEIKGIKLDHILRDDPLNPQIYIRYGNPRQQYKERKLALDPQALAVIDAYVAEYGLTDELFTCTPRNLEYILKDIASEAELDGSLLSFENLRWVSALNDVQAGMDDILIREKLGLSKITWRETRSKLERLREKQQED